MRPLRIFAYRGHFLVFIAISSNLHSYISVDSIMGAQFSLSIRDYVHPEEAPRTDRPPTFDPLYGFPNGEFILMKTL